jgi:fatty-acid desaturase
MKEPIFYYVYIFIIKVGKLVQVNIIKNKKLPLLIKNIVSTFTKNCQLYINEIFLEVLAKILEFILNNIMVCLNIFGGVVMYVYLVMFICVFMWHLHFPLC